MMTMIMIRAFIYLQDECWSGDGEDRSRGRYPRDNSAMTSSAHHLRSPSYEAISSFTRRSHISVIPKMYVGSLSPVKLPPSLCKRLLSVILPVCRIALESGTAQEGLGPFGG